MSEDVFRKKSLDKIKSPESLNDHIRVANPGVWLLLISVIFILAGACVWGIFGHIDSTVKTSVCVESGTAVCWIDEEDLTSVKSGMVVEFDDYEAVVAGIGEKEERGYICTLESEQSISDGYYDGKIVTNSFSPIIFVFN